MKKTVLSILIIAVLLFMTLQNIYAGPQSTTYELKEYGFGSGGNDSAGANSTNYTIFGTAGEVDNSSANSTTYTTNNGLIWTMQANIPAAPTVTNVSTNYDRLKIVIDNGANPTDVQFVIAISSDNFVTTKYIQADFTRGTSMVWQTYSTWGGASGFTVTGLDANTTYKVKVKARQGNFTESAWSATGSAATVDSTLTFSADSSSVTFNNLSPSNSYTDSSKTNVLTTSTNAYNGYTIYGRETQPLTYGSNTIADYTSPNSAPTVWSGSGFGYTTNDNNLAGGTVDRFTNGGPKYAGFTTSAPGDPVADHAAPVTTAISNEQFTITYRVTGTATTPPGQYTTTVIYTVVPSY